LSGPAKRPCALHASLRAALADLREVPIRFERQGTRLIYVGDNS
jgi:hypothetical protein